MARRDFLIPYPKVHNLNLKKKYNLLTPSFQGNLVSPDDSASTTYSNNAPPLACLSTGISQERLS